MRTAVYCVSKNGYETCLKIKENVYNDLHIYVSGRVANLLNLENENIENLFIIYFIIKQRIVYLRVKKVSKYFIDSILGKIYTKELIVENEIQEIKKSDLIENWIKLLESKLSKLVLKKYVYRKVPEYEELIEDFIHFESDDKKKILEILKSKEIIEKSKIPKKEKKLLYQRLKL